MPTSTFYTDAVAPSVECAFTDISLLHASENGYSEVYKGAKQGKWHTLKRLVPEECANPRYQELLRKEFDISYNLSHPYIVHTVGMEMIDGLGLCIVQEYVDGIPWSSFFGEKRVTSNERLRILSELCDAISYIHSHQIVHRDLKPDNILITRDGHHPRIIDFGLADRDAFIYLKEPAGTTGYASPEQQTIGEKIDNRSDIYSLGVLIKGVAPAWSLRCRRVAQKCLAENPDRRFANADTVKRHLQPIRRSVWVFLLMATAIAMISVWGYQSYQQQNNEMVKMMEQNRIQQQRLEVLNRQLGERANGNESSATSTPTSQAATPSSSINNTSQAKDVSIATVDNALNDAKSEIRKIANERYQKLYKNNISNGMSENDARLNANNEIYKEDYNTIITSLVKKHHLPESINGVDIQKILYDTWLFALYDMRKAND